MFPYIGPKPISAINAPELLACLRRIEARGKHDTAHAARQLSGAVFRYAIACGLAERDPAADLRDALAPIDVINRAAITDPKELGSLLRMIDGHRGQPQVEYALKIAPCVFLRPGELCFAQWAEIDLDKAIWRIPETRMKMGREHLVPLATQVVKLFRGLQDITGVFRWCFPGLRAPKDRPISTDALNAALRRMGITQEQHCAHGFRSTASTLLNEQGFREQVIERQLAHVDRNEIRGIYNRAKYLTERTQMMQAWADYLDGLKTGATVIPFKHKAG